MAAVSALVLGAGPETPRGRMWVDVARDVRGGLSDIPEISRLALGFDALLASDGRHRAWALYELQRDLARFYEWRVGRAQEAWRAAAAQAWP